MPRNFEYRQNLPGPRLQPGLNDVQLAHQIRQEQLARMAALNSASYRNAPGYLYNRVTPYMQQSFGRYMPLRTYGAYNAFPGYVNRFGGYSPYGLSGGMYPGYRTMSPGYSSYAYQYHYSYGQAPNVLAHPQAYGSGKGYVSDDVMRERIRAADRKDNATLEHEASYRGVRNDAEAANVDFVRNAYIRAGWAGYTQRPDFVAQTLRDYRYQSPNRQRAQSHFDYNAATRGHYSEYRGQIYDPHAMTFGRDLRSSGRAANDGRSGIRGRAFPVSSGVSSTGYDIPRTTGGTYETPKTDRSSAPKLPERPENVAFETKEYSMGPDTSIHIRVPGEFLAGRSDKSSEEFGHLLYSYDYQTKETGFSGGLAGKKMARQAGVYCDFVPSDRPGYGKLKVSFTRPGRFMVGEYLKDEKPLIVGSEKRVWEEESRRRTPDMSLRTEQLHISNLSVINCKLIRSEDGHPTVQTLRINPADLEDGKDVHFYHGISIRKNAKNYEFFFFQPGRFIVNATDGMPPSTHQVGGTFDVANKPGKGVSEEEVRTEVFYASTHMKNIPRDQLGGDFVPGSEPDTTATFRRIEETEALIRNLPALRQISFAAKKTYDKDSLRMDAGSTISIQSPFRYLFPGAGGQAESGREIQFGIMTPGDTISQFMGGDSSFHRLWAAQSGIRFEKKPDGSYNVAFTKAGKFIVNGKEFNVPQDFKGLGKPPKNPPSGGIKSGKSDVGEGKDDLKKKPESAEPEKNREMEKLRSLAQEMKILQKQYAEALDATKKTPPDYTLVKNLDTTKDRPVVQIAKDKLTSMPKIGGMQVIKEGYDSTVLLQQQMDAVDALKKELADKVEAKKADTKEIESMRKEIAEVKERLKKDDMKRAPQDMDESLSVWESAIKTYEILGEPELLKNCREIREGILANIEAVEKITQLKLQSDSLGTEIKNNPIIKIVKTPMMKAFLEDFEMTSSLVKDAWEELPAPKIKGLYRMVEAKRFQKKLIESTEKWKNALQDYETSGLLKEVDFAKEKIKTFRQWIEKNDSDKLNKDLQKVMNNIKESVAHHEATLNGKSKDPYDGDVTWFKNRIAGDAFAYIDARIREFKETVKKTEEKPGDAVYKKFDDLTKGKKPEELVSKNGIQNLIDILENSKDVSKEDFIKIAVFCLKVAETRGTDFEDEKNALLQKVKKVSGERKE